MGFPMAGHLANAGHQVRVWNRTPAVAQKWVNLYPGMMMPTAEEAVRAASIVFACLGDDPDVREVAHLVFTQMQKGAVFVDHTTTSASLARELNELAEKTGIGFVDAPVSGGEAGAINGKLTIMCGGSQADFASVRPVMDCYGRAIKWMGVAGTGQLTKMVNQICIAGVVQGLAEGLHFAEQAGLDPVAVVEAIAQGAAQSWQMDHRHQTMARGEYDFGFAVDWMRKDLRVTLEEASKNGATLPVTQMVDGFYEQVQQLGGNRWDTSSLIERLRRI